MTQIDVTVCVTTCNQQRYIRQCLESVLAQNGGLSVEILVGDDCSEDGTSEIVADVVAAHPGRMIHVRHSPRLGASQNTQALLARAKGRYIARLDGDDYWLPGKLSRQVAFLEAQAECVAVYTNAVTIDESGQATGLFNDVGDATFDLAAMLRSGNFLNNSSLLLRRELVPAWLAINGPLIDYQAHLLHARVGLLGHVGEPLVAYRVASSESMVFHDNAKVRELYWQAIHSVPRELVTRMDFTWALADFMRRVCFHALSSRNAALVNEWMPRVLSAAPVGKWRMLSAIAGAILSATTREVLGKLNGLIDRRRRAILYRQ